MSYMTIHGLRFRRVTLAHGGCYTANTASLCDALICCRCTAVVADAAQAERHLCLTRFYLTGLSFADVEEVPMPHEPRRRVAIAHHLHHADIWPHGAKILKAKGATPLSERYETLSVLFAELAAMERAVEKRWKRQR